jgi:hypothetical protein
MVRLMLTFSALALAAAPAAASSYSALLAAPISGRFIAPDIVWYCGPAACQGATDESRPLVLCQSLARQVGPIDSFIADGRALSPGERDRCNASARSRKTSSLAAQ